MQSGNRASGLAVLLGVLVAGLAIVLGVRVGLDTGFVDPSSPVAAWEQAVPFFLAASLVAFFLLIGFRTLARVHRRRTGHATSASLRGLETLTAIVLVVVIFVAVFEGVATAALSVSLIGFGLTLALQRPILSMAGWAYVRFARLFREGDRIEVQGIVGDVLEVGLFQTKLWEIGSTKSPLPWGGAVSPLRQTGRTVILSNATWLEQPVANATGDVSIVYDEFSVPVAPEGDWRLAESLLRRIASEVLDLDAHEEAARQYERITRHMPMATEFQREPVVIMSLQDSWIELRLRYLVDVRSRSQARTALAKAWQEETEKRLAELPPVYPRSQTQRLAADGRPLDVREPAGGR